jgi:hypothetical protein
VGLCSFKAKYRYFQANLLILCCTATITLVHGLVINMLYHANGA